MSLDVLDNAKAPLRRYRRIDWSKPPPVIDNEPRTMFTEAEAHEKNRAFRFNKTTYRWVLDESHENEITFSE